MEQRTVHWYHVEMEALVTFGTISEERNRRIKATDQLPQINCHTSTPTTAIDSCLTLTTWLTKEALPPISASDVSAYSSSLRGRYVTDCTYAFN